MGDKTSAPLTCETSCEVNQLGLCQLFPLRPALTSKGIALHLGTTITTPYASGLQGNPFSYHGSNRWSLTKSVGPCWEWGVFTTHVDFNKAIDTCFRHYQYQFRSRHVKFSKCPWIMSLRFLPSVNVSNAAQSNFKKSPKIAMSILEV